MTKGRKRKLGPREPNGKPQREPTAKEIDKMRSVALAQPHRRGEISQRAGFVLGRLRLTQEISEEQFQAGERYASLASRHMRHVLGCSYHWPTTSLANSVGGGAMNMSTGEPDTDELERHWSDAMSALAEYGLMTTGTRALAKICLMDREPERDELGNARLALNVLYRLWENAHRRSKSLHTITTRDLTNEVDYGTPVRNR